MPETSNMYRLRNFEEERTRTLYVRLPHRIRSTKEVEELFKENDNVKVKLPRQASRACHVMFDKVEDKILGLKNLKDKTINGKKIFARNPRTKPTENKISRKKLIVPKPEKGEKITQTLFVSNIKDKTTVNDLKEAFPGCKTIAMLDLNSRGLRSAFVKMGSLKLAEEYLRRSKEWPEINGNKISIHSDTRIGKKGRRGAKSKNMKIYDQDGKETLKNFDDIIKQETKSNEDVDDSETENESEIE